MEQNRVAVMAIIVREGDSVAALNALLHAYGDSIIGRMGVPYRSRGVSLISIAMDAPGSVISALSGKIGHHGENRLRPGRGPGPGPGVRKEYSL